MGRPIKPLMERVADLRYYGHKIEKIAVIKDITPKEVRKLLLQAKEAGYETPKKKYIKERQRLGELCNYEIIAEMFKEKKKKLEEGIKDLSKEKTLDELKSELAKAKPTKKKLIMNEIEETVIAMAKKIRSNKKVIEEITNELGLTKKNVIHSLTLARNRNKLEKEPTKIWELALVLYSILGKSNQEISNILDVEENSVPSYVRFAREKGMNISNNVRYTGEKAKPIEQRVADLNNLGYRLETIAKMKKITAEEVERLLIVAEKNGYTPRHNKRNPKKQKPTVEKVATLYNEKKKRLYQGDSETIEAIVQKVRENKIVMGEIAEEIAIEMGIRKKRAQGLICKARKAGLIEATGSGPVISRLVRDLDKRGFSYTQISQSLGVKATSIPSYLKHFEREERAPRRKRKKTKVNLSPKLDGKSEQVIALREEGFSDKAIERIVFPQPEKSKHKENKKVLLQPEESIRWKIAYDLDKKGERFSFADDIPVEKIERRLLLLEKGEVPNKEKTPLLYFRYNKLIDKGASEEEARNEINDTIRYIKDQYLAKHH
ncbi:MAG: hypothetical protein FWE47_02460 [Oscillospiraceae bacterium]|nr:hypothetical protein [Oscillospiraceae bacterium]